MDFSPLPLSLCCIPSSQLHAAPPAGAILVRAPAQQPISLALLVLRSGAAALPHGAGPPSRVLLPPGPSLDDLLAGWLCASALRFPKLERLCEYAAQLGEGILPGPLPPERSLGGMYLAIRELYREQPQLLVERGVLLLGAAAQALTAGRSLLHDDLFAADERFAREAAYLDSDRRRYERDRQAGTVFSVRAGPLCARLLWLRQPTSILFRLFAHRDAKAPGGYDLVLSERAGQAPGTLHIALFADPTRRLPLKPALCALARELDRLEDAAPAEPWYDGARHGYQRLASPRRGTSLPRRRIEAALRRTLGAVPPSPPRSPGLLFLAALLLCLAPAAPSRHPEPVIDPVIVRGDWQQHRLPVGRALPAAEKQALLADRDGVRRYALLMAANGYAPRSRGGLGPLRTPWRDACALREVLVRRFGYRRADIALLADSPCLKDVAGPPTREQLLLTLEHLPVRPTDTLLFYYSGHGAIEDEPGGRYGYLQPAGWEQPGVSREDRGLRMRVLAELLRDKVAARHQLLLIDACHSGETAIVRGSDAPQMEAPARARWQERPVYAVITAGGKDDLVLEERLVDSPHPHSLFMRALLEGLSYGPRNDGTCGLRADTDPRVHPDGLLTDGEIFKYLARRVPELRAAIDVPGLPEDEQRQVPEWNPWAAVPRGDPAQRIGEFLLVPRTPPPARCDVRPEPLPAGDGCGQCPP